MKVNVYAEEIEASPEPSIVKRISNGVEYHGLHFGVGPQTGVTLWFTSRAKMIDTMYGAVNVATGVIQ